MENEKIDFSDVQRIQINNGNRPLLENLSSLREWMPFSDNEISIFQIYFMDYFLENEDSLSKKDVYKLACLASETQFQIRLLKGRISGDGNIDESSNNRFLRMLISFDGLIEFVKNKMIDGYEKTSQKNKFELAKQPYSYFSSTDDIKENIKRDFDLYFGDFNKELEILNEPKKSTSILVSGCSAEFINKIIKQPRPLMESPYNCPNTGDKRIGNGCSYPNCVCEWYL